MDMTTIYSALWLGILTAISPCPMATNVAAISLIGGQASNKLKVLFSAFMYTMGRTVTYLVLGVTISSGISASRISLFLQNYLNELLGPLMILLGLMLLNMIGKRLSIGLEGDKIQKIAVEKGGLYAFPLGVLFALSFCPVSAGLFFGAMIPLAVQSNSLVVVPILYGFATAIPIVIFAFIIAFSSNILSKAFDGLKKVDLFLRTATGLIFIGVGIYYCLRYNLEFFSAL